MSTPLPDLLDPWRAVGNGAVFAGHLPLSSLPRLRGLLLDEEGEVGFRLAFSRDEGHRAMLRCEVVAKLKLCCQRCLQVLEREVGADVLLALVSSLAEERRLPEGFDPLLVSDKPIRLRDLIEDELLLALPQIPMHEPDECTVQLSGVNVAQARAERAGPFAELVRLKRET